MANEQFQARLDDGFAEKVHEYREERHMSKSETVRAALRELVIEGDGQREERVEAESEATADDDRERVRRLALIGERAAIASLIFITLAMAVPIASYAAVSYFGLTVGTFGSAVVAVGMLTCMFGSVLAMVVGSVCIGAALIRDGIYVGWFGKRLDRFLSGEVAAQPAGVDG